MGCAIPFQKLMFQELFNGIKKFSIQWILTLVIAFWKFKSPLGLQLPKWESTWECVGSFPHSFLHSQEHEMWLSSFIFSPHLCKLYFGCKPKARVTTMEVYYKWLLKLANNLHTPTINSFLITIFKIRAIVIFTDNNCMNEKGNITTLYEINIIAWRRDFRT